MRKFFSALCGAFLLACSGCNTIPKLSESSDVSSNDDAYFVIGIAPDGTLVHIAHGIVENGKFSSRPTFKFNGSGYLNTVQDGFIVGRAIPGTSLAILGVGFSANVTTFGACQGARTMVFSVPPGKVLYFGNVRFAFPQTPTPNSRVSTSYSDNIAAARDYLKTHYPNLTDKLEHGSVQLLPTDESCVAY